MRFGRTTVIGTVAACLLAAAGYFGWSGLLSPAPERKKPAPQETGPDRPAPPAPEESGGGGKAERVPKVLVDGKAAQERKRKTGYSCDRRIPGGTLKGICYVKYNKRVRISPPFPIELEGAHAARLRERGEVDYYRSRKPTPIVYLDPYHSAGKRYGVRGAVLMVHDVAAGALGNFDRLRYLVDFRTHQIRPDKPEGRGVFNPSAYGIGVMRTKQLVQILNLSLYESDLTLRDTATDKVLWKGVLPKYHDPNFPGQHLGFNPVMKRPEVHQISRIEDRGIYQLSCERHPWQKAYLVLWDNPYVTVSTGTGDLQRHPEQSGAFAINRIPEGTYTVQVWHPEFEPVKETFQVDIGMDRTTPLAVEFKVPPLLKETPKPLPNKTITEWAFAGPFDPLMDEEPDSPNNKLDFAATYDGMDGDVRWKRIKTASGRDKGYVLLHKAMWRIRGLSLSYYAARIHSPKAQRLYLGVHNVADGLKMWLNGKVMFQSYTGDFGRYSRYPGRFIITGDLQAGDNTLLVMVSAENTERSYFSVLYRADGATLTVPVK